MRIFFIIFLLSTRLYAFDSKAEGKKSMHDFFMAIKTKDAKKLKKTTTKKHFKRLSKGKNLEELFNAQDPKGKLSIDIWIQKDALGNSWANAKGKKEEDYDSYWYSLKKVADKFLVGDQIFFEEDPSEKKSRAKRAPKTPQIKNSGD